MRVITVMLSLAVAAFAHAERDPRVSAKFGDQERVMRFGRLMMTDHGPAIVLTEAPHRCDEPVLIPEAYLVIVPLDTELRPRSKFWFDAPRSCYPVPGTASVERANGHVWGRIDVPIANDAGGSGLYDAVYCPLPVRL